MEKYFLCCFVHFSYCVLTWYDKRDKNDMVEKLFDVLYLLFYLFR